MLSALSYSRDYGVSSFVVLLKTASEFARLKKADEKFQVGLAKALAALRGASSFREGLRMEHQDVQQGLTYSCLPELGVKPADW